MCTLKTREVRDISLKFESESNALGMSEYGT
jgi:hypothetical protein